MAAQKKRPARSEVPARPSIHRITGDYASCAADDVDYGPSDLISLLLIRARHPAQGPAPSELAVHFQTFSDAVARGLEVSLDEGVVAAFGDLGWGWGLGNWLDLRKSTLEVVRPFSGVIEGDPWGRRELAGARRAAIEECVQAYRAATLPAVEAVYVIDRAICVLRGWNPDARVSAVDLRERHGATTEYDPMDYF